MSNDPKLQMNQGEKKEMDYAEANLSWFVSAMSERNNAGEGEDDNREDLVIQRGRNRKDRLKTVYVMYLWRRSWWL
ncbi:hypothetical protein P8452_43384 [Trifolium repens]|nr:hypothetical protein P8452_43384 [Trifolium repens]